MRETTTQTLRDQTKIAVLMIETSGPLQQHLHLNAGATPTYVEVRETIMEYYRATTALSRLYQQPGFIQRLNTRPRRTGTYGHWSCQQRIQRKVQQRKREEAQQRKRKKQRQQRQRIRLRVQQRQRKDWTRNAVQRSAQQRRIHRQRQANRKRKRSPNTRMLQTWPIRSHSKRLPCGSTQPQRGYNQHIHWPLAR